MNYRHLSIVLLVSLVLTACGQAAQPLSPTRAEPSPNAAGQSSNGSDLSYTLSAEHAAIFKDLKLTAEPIGYLGDPNAPVILIEFADYGCPYCVRHHQEVFPELKAKYIDTGKVFYMFKDLPIITQSGPNIAQATHCVAEQDASKYWDMHHAMFLRAPEWKVSAAEAINTYRSAASDLGLDADAVEACVSSNSYLRTVLEDRDQGLGLGLRGTPGFMINGRILTGAHPLDVFTMVIDAELSGNPLPSQSN
jgi:protein-disulfide isomerase